MVNVISKTCKMLRKVETKSFPMSLMFEERISDNPTMMRRVI